MNALTNSCKTRNTIHFLTSEFATHKEIDTLNQLIDGTINMNYYRYGVVVGGVLLLKSGP
jgi:hypothetical protein